MTGESLPVNQKSSRRKPIVHVSVVCEQSYGTTRHEGLSPAALERIQDHVANAIEGSETLTKYYDDDFHIIVEADNQ